MAALNLQDVCNKLGSSQVRSRQTALNELQRFLNQDDTASRLGDENTYAAVLHSLIRNFSLEVAAFRKSSSAQATTSLQISVECLRASTEKGRFIMTRPTLKVLVTHILNSLPSLESSGYKIVASSYFATLKLITSHPPHVEQMKKEMWMDLISLCISRVEVQNWIDFSNFHNQPPDAVLSESKLYESRSVLTIRKETVDLMFCLQSLCTFPGAPFDGEEKKLLSFILNFLATYDTQTDARMSAIIALNRLLGFISFNKLELASRTSIAVLHLFSREKQWTTRIHGFKERLFITLSSLIPHLYHTVKQNSLSAETRRAVKSMIDLLMLDSRIQDQRASLRVADLILSALPSSSPLWRQRPFQSLFGPYFSLNPHCHSSELMFISLQLQSSLIYLLDIMPIEAEHDPTLLEGSPRKRRRIESNSAVQNLLLHPLESKSQHSKLASLPTLALYLNSFRILEPSINHHEVLDHLEQLAGGNDAEVINWSFVCMLGVFGRLRGKSSPSTGCTAQWRRIWVACSKQAAIPSTCRAACSVMEVIVGGGFLKVRSLVPHVNGIMEYVEQRGPGLFADKSCDLWTSLLWSLEEDGISTKAWRTKGLSRWLRFRWAVNDVLDLASQPKCIDLLTYPFVRIMSSLPSRSVDTLGFQYFDSLPKSPIGQHLCDFSSNLLLQNLLLECEINTRTQIDYVKKEVPSTDAITLHRDLKPIFQEKCLEISARLTAEDGRVLTEDEVFWYTSIGLMSLSFRFFQGADGILGHITRFISTSDDPGHVDACLKAINQFILIFTPQGDSDYGKTLTPGANILLYGNENGNPALKELVNVLCRASGLFHLKEIALPVNTDFMGRSVQLTISASDLDVRWALRDISRSSMTSEGWRARTLLLLHSKISHGIENSANVSQHDYLRKVPTMSILLAAEQTFASIFDSGDDRTRPMTMALLESFRDDVASTYSWGGNEMTAVAAMTIVEIFLSLKERMESDSEITNLVMQICRWVIKVVINRDLSSANARLRAAKLLLRIAKVDLSHRTEARLESSPGDLLIQMLLDTNVRVKFGLAEDMQPIFLCFPVTDRVNTYRAIVDNLESDETFSEGFALRAYSLMRLALTSDDIRRAAMVNLLELGNFVSCKPMVRACFAHIANVLYQDQLTELLTQNSSQFINSWIEFEEDIFQFPYHVFGFVTYRQWSSSVQSELVSQLLNADRWDNAASSFRSVSPFEDVLINHLPHIISYAFLKHSAQSENGGKVTKVTKQCEAALGSGIFLSTLTSNFAQSVSIMVERLDDKTLSSENFSSAGLSSSAVIFSTLGLPDPGPTYPDPPQPFFSLHQVLAATEELRLLVGIPRERVWSPPHVVYVVRNLITNGSTASDTTVALSYLRRVAFILCVANKTVFAGYPLEMLVHGLCEFASRVAVRREAFAIIRYLFSLVSNNDLTPPRQIRYMTPMLLSAMEERSSPSAPQTTDELSVYDWLETRLLAVFPDHVELRSTVQLLRALRKRPLSNDITACQILENLITEDKKLWGELKLRQFSLQFLSQSSDPLSEPLPSLRRVVGYFFAPFNALTSPDYSSESKVWLGLALGRISRDSRFQHPEYKSLLIGSGNHTLTGSPILCQPEVMDEVLHFIRFDPKIAGRLEDGLRSLPSDITLRLSTRSNDDKDILKCLSSPNIKTPKDVIGSRPPPSDLHVWITPGKDFVSWYKNLACSIAQHLPSTPFSAIVSAIDASVEFCESVFPFLVDEYRSQRRYDGSITAIFNSILKNFSTYDLEYLKLVIRTILFLRERSSKPIKSKKTLLVDDINFFHAANAAVACKMFKAALMFLEMVDDSIATAPEVHQLLSEIYCNLDDPDVAYALSQGVTRSWNQLLHVYELHHDLEAVNDLRRARLRGKVELGLGPSSVDGDLLAVADQIRQNGFPLNITDILDDADNENHSQDPASDLYKSAWRLGNWDLPPLTTSAHPESLIYTVLYQLMQSNLSDQFFTTLNTSISQAVDQLAGSLNPSGKTKMAGCLTMLANVFEVFSAPQTSMASGRAWGKTILRQAEYGSYEELEPSASLHNVIFKIIESRNAIRQALDVSQEETGVMLVQSYLNFCQMTRRCGNSNDLLVALSKTGFLELKYETSDDIASIYPAILTERAEVLWKRQERAEAVETLRSLVKISNQLDFKFTLISKEMILARMGSWTSEMRLIPSDEIVQEIFEPASRYLLQRSVTEGETAGRVFFEYASFCTKQLEDQYVLADIKRMENLHRSKQEEVLRYNEPIQVAKMHNDQTTYKKLMKEHDRAIKLQKMDKEELQRLHNSQRFFLKTALEQFLRCFTASTDFDQHVPKFCAIWLKHSRQAGANSIVAGLLGRVSSHKFIPLLHQLCSRLSDEGKDDFQSCLSQLLSRILNDHPFHAFHQIYSAFTAGEKTATGRSRAAKRIAERMSSNKGNQCISPQEVSARLAELFSSYSELAKLPVNKSTHQGNDIPLSQYPGLRKFRSKGVADLRLPPPSLDIPISPTSDYAALPFVQKYHHSFKIAGGVNQPKILDSILSTGRSFRELVKGGNDDLHQDAIMQQIFQQMDGVMQRSRETRRRAMRIRTYKVIPLKPQTGVIEWVLETTPLLEYLEKTHVAINPGDWKWSVCRQKIYEAATKDHQKRLAVYQEVCQHFKPVLRYFFLEHFRDPDSWLSRKINYSRSVAASSMIGHILGLGDRHGQNILLDKKTGEIIHIDLGVAFEQGKLLFVPEIVPFRLTRDMIDGFGMSGCEGTFMRASTFALTVFREEEDTISTFLDVLKYDPLYNWTISPLKMWALQQEMQNQETKIHGRQNDSLPDMEADRAIQMVKRKLSSRLSPEADVRRLILEATDEGNLSRMYCGWAAFA